MVISKELQEVYKRQPDSALVQAKLMSQLIDSNEWRLVLDAINLQADTYKTKLETAELEKVKELQYAIQNLKNLSMIPRDIIDSLNTLGSVEPPSSIKNEDEFSFMN